MDTKCVICKDPATKTITQGNPKYIDKPVCDYCNTYRKLMMKEDTKDEKLWRKLTR